MNFNAKIYGLMAESRGAYQLKVVVLFVEETQVVQWVFWVVCKEVWGSMPTQIEKTPEFLCEHKNIFSIHLKIFLLSQTTDITHISTTYKDALTLKCFFFYGSQCLHMVVSFFFQTSTSTYMAKCYTKMELWTITTCCYGMLPFNLKSIYPISSV